jgi:hypothetical protein
MELTLRWNATAASADYVLKYLQKRSSAERERATGRIP